MGQPATRPGADSSGGCESGGTEDVVPRYAPNKMSAAVKRRYFELLREGVAGAEAARRVGVSTSCGSLWFIDAGSVRALEPTAISRRFLSQGDRIEIADGLGRGEPVKSIAARIGKSYQAVYREIARNRKVRRQLPAVLRPQPGLPAPPPAQAVAVGRRLPAAGARGRQAAPPVVTGADHAVAAASLPTAARLASVRRDDLRQCLPGLARPAGCSQAAHRPDLPASPRSRQNPRRCLQAVHVDALDP